RREASMSRRRKCQVPSAKCRVGSAHSAHSALGTRHSALAFTLIEVTLAVAVSSILLLGMGVCLAMTASAADSGDDSLASSSKATDALNQLGAEISVATDANPIGPGDILLTVPDRNADGAPETIEYTWSSKAGDPLKRSYNGSTAIAVATDIRALS